MTSVGLSSPATSLRILAVLNTAPLHEPHTGGGIRCKHLVEALAAAGTLDVFVASVTSAGRMEYVSSLAIRAGSIDSPAKVGFLTKARSIARRPLWPTRVAMNRNHLRSQFLSWLSTDPPYDVVFFECIDHYLPLTGLIDWSCVVDMDDLNSSMLRQNLTQIWADVCRRKTSLPRRLALILKLITYGRGYISWRRVEAQTVKHCSSVLVCSSEDHDLLGRPRNAVLAPNPTSIRVSNPPAGLAHRRRNGPPTLIFCGAMSYEPNSTGVRWFANEVLQRMRAQIPDLKLLVVGHGSDKMGLEMLPGVEPLGFVRDLESVFAEADIAVVPLRTGTGTRLKVLDAWAAGLPVVSTRIGAYGLGATDGVHLLLAETIDEFSGSIKRLLESAPLRSELALGGADLALRHSPAILSGAVRQAVVGEAEPAMRLHASLSPYPSEWGHV